MNIPTQPQAPNLTGSQEVPTALLTPTQRRFYASEECGTARTALQRLVDNPRYDTDSTYFRESELNFVDRHLYYLSTHPLTTLAGYLSNLKLMTGRQTRS